MVAFLKLIPKAWMRRGSIAAVRRYRKPKQSGRLPTA
jgi:hypothetical protein